MVAKNRILVAKEKSMVEKSETGHMRKRKWDDRKRKWDDRKCMFCLVMWVNYWRIYQMYPVSITLIHMLHLCWQKMMFVHTGQHSVDTPGWSGGSGRSSRIVEIEEEALLLLKYSSSRRSYCSTLQTWYLDDRIVIQSDFFLACALNSNPQTPSISG